jgi:hypothetical protein
VQQDWGVLENRGGMIDCFKSEQIELGSGDPAAGATALASAFDGDSIETEVEDDA